LRLRRAKPASAGEPFGARAIVGRRIELAGELADEAIDLGRARERTEEPVGGAGRSTDHEDLVAVEELGSLGVDHRADDQHPNRTVGLVLELMRARSTDRAGDNVTGLEQARSVEGAQRRPPRENDNQLLVGVVEMKR
jgi:hypothetical protein